MATDPKARVIANLLLLQRVGNTLTADVRKKYRALFQEIAADLVRLDPTAVGADIYRIGRTDKLAAQIRERVEALTPALQKELRNALAALGKQQGQWAAVTIETSIGKPGIKPRSLVSVNLAKAILDTRVFGDPDKGRVSLLSGWVEGLQEATVQRLEQTIRAGMLREETLQELRDRVRVVRETTERNAEAVVRTAVNDISNAAHDRTYRANADLLSGVQFLATLDDRTTVRCAALDQQIFAVDDDKRPIPPLHINCRSLYVPIVNWERVGLEQPTPVDRFARDLDGFSAEDLDRPVSERKALPNREGLGTQEKVPGTTNYEQWLRQQSEAVQNKVLGVGKAKLFREGDITLRDLIRKDGTVRPLSELLED